MNLVVTFCHRSVIYTSFHRSVQQRQAYFKERNGSDLALHTYLATVGLDNPLYNGQAQTATAWPFVIRLTNLC
jgi:hypothetical protein